MEVRLKEGLPQVLKPIEKDLPFNSFSHTSLKTGIDSLNVFFGTFMQGSKRGNWIAIGSQGVPAHFSTVSLEEVDTMDHRVKDIHLEYNQNRNSASVRVIEIDSVTFKYSWMDGSELSKKLVLKTVQQPMRKGLKFPEIELIALNGERISSNQFKDQFVVIN